MSRRRTKDVPPQQNVPRRSSWDVREVDDSPTRRGPGSRDGLRYGAIAVLVQTLTRPGVPLPADRRRHIRARASQWKMSARSSPPHATRVLRVLASSPRFVAPPAKGEFGIIPCSMVVHSYIVRGRRDSFRMPVIVPAPNVSLGRRSQEITIAVQPIGTNADARVHPSAHTWFETLSSIAGSFPVSAVVSSASCPSDLPTSKTHSNRQRSLVQLAPAPPTPFEAAPSRLSLHGFDPPRARPSERAMARTIRHRAPPG